VSVNYSTQLGRMSNTAARGVVRHIRRGRSPSSQPRPGGGFEQGDMQAPGWAVLGWTTTWTRASRDLAAHGETRPAAHGVLACASPASQGMAPASRTRMRRRWVGGDPAALRSVPRCGPRHDSIRNSQPEWPPRLEAGISDLSCRVALSPLRQVSPYSPLIRNA
jgi:hypothetical protein